MVDNKTKSWALTLADIKIITEVLELFKSKTEWSSIAITHIDDGRFPGPLQFGYDESETFGFLGFGDTDE